MGIVPTPSVTTRYSGSQTITTSSFSSGGSTQYRLRETRGSNSVEINTFNSGNVNSVAQTDFVNAADTWTSLGSDISALDAHWAAEMVFDYWNTVRGVSGIDGSNKGLTSYVHYNYPYSSTPTLAYHSGYDRSIWDFNNEAVLLGDGYYFFNPLVSLDICAHEFAHGYTNYARSSPILVNSTSELETWALNEGISDIWGAVVENYAAPSKDMWKIGEEVTKDGYPSIRSLANPKTDGDQSIGVTGNSSVGGSPDTYNGTYWEPSYYVAESFTLSQYGQTNGTVIGHWFYLLSVGGSGTNDNSDSYNVKGIGVSNAASIVWRAETNYFGATSDFSDAASYFISAATDLFGTCSNEVIQVMNALHAVGMGSAATNGSYTVSGTNPICSSASYSIASLPSGSTGIHWYANPSGLVSFSSATANPTTVSKVSDGVVAMYAIFNNSGTCVSTPDASIQSGSGNPPTGTLTYDASCGTYLQGVGTNYPLSTTGFTWTMDYSTTTNTSLSVSSGNLLITPFISSPSNGSTYTHYFQIQAITSCGTTATNAEIYVATIGPIDLDNCNGNIQKIINKQISAIPTGEINQIAVYPNPVHNSFTITVPPDSINIAHAVIKVLGLDGRLFKLISSVSQSNIVDISNLANGAYIIEITDSKKRIIKKIVKN
jgi:Zn-dependent metalloprotease